MAAAFAASFSRGGNSQTPSGCTGRRKVLVRVRLVVVVHRLHVVLDRLRLLPRAGQRAAVAHAGEGHVDEGVVVLARAAEVEPGGGHVAVVADGGAERERLLRHRAEGRLVLDRGGVVRAGERRRASEQAARAPAPAPSSSGPPTASSYRRAGPASTGPGALLPGEGVAVRLALGGAEDDLHRPGLRALLPDLLARRLEDGRALAGRHRGRPRGEPARSGASRRGRWRRSSWRAGSPATPRWRGRRSP